MKISSKLLKAWSAKRTRGDIPRLVEFANASKPTIIKALKHGQGNEQIILKISRFYSERNTQKEIESTALNLISNVKARENI